MKIVIFQKGFNYSQDGPGNRLVYRMQGCNMRCPWCANPEGMAASGGTACDAEALLEEIQRSRSMFFEGGGVTFTGGEPTMQFEALGFLLRALKGQGIDTAIETNGTHPRLPELFDCIDHLIVDFKQPFAQRHRAITGVDSSNLLSNLRRAAREHPDVLVRIPFVNGYNASREDMEQFARVLSEFGGVPVELLRYHEYGRAKWDRMGLTYPVENGFVSEEQVSGFLSILHAHGVRTVRT